MNTSFNKSQIFKAAWNMVKNAGKSLSEALKAAWAQAKNILEADELGRIISDKAFVAYFSLDFSQSKERGWVKNAGAKWDALKKEWVLNTKEVAIASSNLYGKHVLDAHLVSLAKNIQLA